MVVRYLNLRVREFLTNLFSIIFFQSLFKLHFCLVVKVVEACLEFTFDPPYTATNLGTDIQAQMDEHEEPKYSSADPPIIVLFLRVHELRLESLDTSEKQKSYRFVE